MSPNPGLQRKELGTRRMSGNGPNLSNSLPSSSGNATGTSAARPPRPQIIERQGSHGHGRERLPSYDRAMPPRAGGQGGRGLWPSPQKVIQLNHRHQQVLHHQQQHQPFLELPPQLQQPSLQDNGHESYASSRANATSDVNMLLASLERPAVEDEAEATLIDVLERRHVTFADPGGASTHRRNRTYGGGLLSSGGGLSLSDVAAQLSRSNNQQTHVPVPLQRPSHISRGSSLGRSKRHVLDSPPPALVKRGATAPAQSDGQLDGASCFVGGSIEMHSPAPSGDDFIPSAENRDNMSYSHNSQRSPPSGASPTRDVLSRSLPRRGLGKPPSFTARNLKHRRVMTSHPSVSGGNVSAQSSVSGLTTGFSSTALSSLSTPAERAFHLSMAMKTASPSTNLSAINMDDSTSFMDEGALPDLLNLVQAKRERDEESLERGEEISRGSRGSNSRKSGGRRESTSQSAGSVGGSNQGENSSGRPGGRRRGRSHKPFAGISSPFARDQGATSNIDLLFEAAEQVDELFNIPEGEESEDEKTDAVSSRKDFSTSIRSQSSVHSNDFASENAAWLSQLAESHPEIPPPSPGSDVEGGIGFEPVGADEQTPILEKAKLRRNLKSNAWYSRSSIAGNPRLAKIKQWLNVLCRQFKLLGDAFDSLYVKECLFSFFQNQVSTFIVPALAVSAFFFYRLGNPTFEFLPSDASVSWWILFSIRAFLTLHLAYATEYVFVDVFSLRTPFSVKIIGSLATLYTVNSKGWPFIVTTWGVWNFLLLQGNHAFVDHWLYFTGIEMFTAANPSGGVIESGLYKEILTSMIIAGVATSIKRTFMALYLGTRVYIHYKPKLEKVMVDMLLLSEVAELATAVDEVEFEKIDSPVAGEPRMARESSVAQAVMHATIHDLVQKDPVADSDDEDLEKRELKSKSSAPWNLLRSSSVASADEETFDKKFCDDLSKASKAGSQLSTPAESKPQKAEKNQPGDKVFADSEYDSSFPPHIQENYIADELPALDNAEPPFSSVNEPVQAVLRQDSSGAQIKSFLDRWEEPVNKLDKESDPTIHQILQFRKALSFLDDTHPFSLYFGPANTRDSCLRSSKNLYKRLLGFEPGSSVLRFDVLGVLAYDAEGNFDEKKAKGLVRLFRPDKYDEVSLLAFVQTCDGVYKRLRYLRASVGNSTLIDYVLENIFNSFFYFILGLIILSVLEMNPWALLVSMSTIIVSLSFALGPSAAKLIEGMMMIAIRRPFDLGDRISIVDLNGKPGDADPGFSATWFVEDCSLFTTTLRLARTNEVCTVNNGAISNSRIVNHGRSVNAMVNIELPMNFSVSHEQVQIVKSALEQYISDNPRMWTCLVNFRVARIDPSKNLIVYAARVQNVKSWQELLPVLQAKGELLKFCTEILVKLGIEYQCTASLHDLFVKDVPTQLNFPFESEALSVHSAPPMTK